MSTICERRAGQVLQTAGRIEAAVVLACYALFLGLADGSWAWLNGLQADLKDPLSSLRRIFLAHATDANPMHMQIRQEKRATERSRLEEKLHSVGDELKMALDRLEATRFRFEMGKAIWRQLLKPNEKIMRIRNASDARDGTGLSKVLDDLAEYASKPERLLDEAWEAVRSDVNGRERGLIGRKRRSCVHKLAQVFSIAGKFVALNRELTRKKSIGGGSLSEGKELLVLPAQLKVLLEAWEAQTHPGAPLLRVLVARLNSIDLVRKEVSR